MTKINKSIIIFTLLTILLLSLLSINSFARLSKTQIKKNILPPNVSKTTFITYRQANGQVTTSAVRTQLIQTSLIPNSCAQFMGPKWNLDIGVMATSTTMYRVTQPVAVNVNPTNHNGLTTKNITNALNAAAETWDSEVPVNLFVDNATINPASDPRFYDGINTIGFKDLGSTSIIAQTFAYSDISNFNIIEFDMELNGNVPWGNGSINAYDLQNILTHELGHSIGFKDVYDSSCAEATMFGYASLGEISKRDLESSDIYGVQLMYGYPLTRPIGPVTDPIFAINKSDNLSIDNLTLKI